jgi:hypothetical protein
MADWTAMGSTPAPARGWPKRATLAGIVAGLLLLAGLGALYLATPARDHVAPGCLWWTARSVDDVVAGYRGCVRGYFAPGGGLADSPDSAADAMKMYVPVGACRPRPGEAMVVRGEAIFDDGRTSITVDQCR